MKTIQSTLHIGVKQPFSVVHISDTHLTYADMRDGERKVELARGRKTCFPYDEEAVLQLASDTAKEKGVPIVHTGDLRRLWEASKLTGDLCVYCFGWQEDFVRSFLGDKVEILIADFDKVERLLFDKYDE